MYYPCSENKGADQLRGYREADLHLCFRLGKNPVFSRCGSISPSESNVLFAGWGWDHVGGAAGWGVFETG